MADAIGWKRLSTESTCGKRESLADARATAYMCSCLDRTLAGDELVRHTNNINLPLFNLAPLPSPHQDAHIRTCAYH